MSESLLTVKQVAELLQISTRTVYGHADSLGGFYPLGIRRLRFNAKDIHERLERQAKGVLAVRLPVPGKKVHWEQVQNQEGCGKCTGKRAGKGGVTGKGNQFRIDPASDRHGLLRSVKTLPRLCGEEIR